MTIDVVYTPPAGFNLLYPPNYKTNTDVTFICRAEGASGDVKYQWSTAKGKLPADSNSQTLTKTMLNSYDTGNYTCTATDANNSTGSISTEMQVIGESLEKLHYNNYENAKYKLLFTTSITEIYYYRIYTLIMY